MSVEDRVAELAAGPEPVDMAASTAARARHDRLVKPPGSLGRLEALGLQLAGIARTSPPPVPEHPAALIAVGDHGVLRQGVSRWPADVTPAMVGEYLAGRAGASALASVVGAQVSVLDVGVAHALRPHPCLRAAKVRAGTADLTAAPAMGRGEAARAVLAGANVAEELTGAGFDLLVGGDMGIGNTTPAACLIALFTGLAAERVTGPGAGGDARAVARKVTVVERALQLHRPSTEDPLGALAAVGGLEHAALVGLMLGGATARVPIVVDGVSTVAAALAGVAMSEALAGYLIAGHRSPEPGAGAGLKHLGLEPLLDLGMRLGEATGGLLAVPLVQSAAAALGRMATFEEAGIAA